MTRKRTKSNASLPTRLLGGLARLVLGVIVLLALVVVAANVITITQTRDDVRSVAELADCEADAVVVLGASVASDGTPSDMLADRLDTAIELYQAGAAPAIIVSGDNRPSHNFETEAMERYCVERGVPSDDVYQDRAGYSTYDSMYRAQRVFASQRIIVATQEYHLYRALFSAQELGMEAYGVASGQGAYEGQMMYDAREALARTKDFFLAKLGAPFLPDEWRFLLLFASDDHS